MPVPDKAQLRKRLLEVLQEERDVVAGAQRLSQEGATHEENRAEGDKDMRATEASYLARGQALRVLALEEDLARVAGMSIRELAEGAPAGLGALVEIAAESGNALVFLAPAGGGTRLQEAAGLVLVVTPASPMGRALVGARAGDEVEVARGGKVELVEVVAVT